MEILCKQCQQPFEVRVIKPAMAKPDGLRREERGPTLRFSWWSHNQNRDYRLPMLFLAAFLCAVAYNRLPPAGLEATWHAFRYAPGGLWERDWQTMGDLTLTLVTTAIALWGLIWMFARRRIVEWDGSCLRCWAQPGPRKLVELLSREVGQLSVSPSGQLRSRDRKGVHIVLTRGNPEAMRYLEQQLEERLHIEDVAVDGEWQGGRWAHVESRRCPHCDFDMSAPPPEAEVEAIEVVLPMGESLPAPAGLVRQQIGNRLEMSWSWAHPVLLFLTLWLCIWDSVVLGILSSGLSLLAHGNILGLGVLFIPHVWVGFGVTYLYLAMLLNRTRITIERGQLRLECGPVPWPGYNKSFDCSNLSQLFVVCHPGNKTTTYSLEARLKNGETVKILSNESNVIRARYLEQEIERVLQIVDQPMPGEMAR